jgi:hypothetical protein
MGSISVIAVNHYLKAKADTSSPVEYYDANAMLCPDGDCRVIDMNGERVFFDRGHLMLNASWKIGRKIIELNGLPAVMDLSRNRIASDLPRAKD